MESGPVLLHRTYPEDPTKPAEPKVEECLPVTSLDDLLAWEEDPKLTWPSRVIPRSKVTRHRVAGYGLDCHKNVNNCSPQPKIEARSTPKTVLCHDMKGGYQQDRFPDGVQESNMYTFFHWAAIDSFIYFSHHLVTVPPLGWLNAGHRHGCKVLGTFITESNEGEGVWKDIMEDEAILKAVVNKLVAICRFYKFDGYLLNIENVINPDHCHLLVLFVKTLKAELKLNCKQETDVIWYDSVTFPDGNLSWQNKLNDLNRIFFDNCDGIFLNYSWREIDLKETASLAGSRVLDVYVGVDVFGRNCFGGGGFNSVKAVDRVREHGLSLAIFAPGWTFEKCEPGIDYLPREFLFWNYLWKHLYVHGPASLPFSTSFCIGKGLKKYLRGRIVTDHDWGCLSEQAYQLSTCYCMGDYDREQFTNDDEFAAMEGGCIKVFDKEAFTGGTSLIFTRSSSNIREDIFYFRLFMCEFQHSSDVLVSYSYKSFDKMTALAVVLLVESEDGYRRVYLLPEAVYELLYSGDLLMIKRNPQDEVVTGRTITDDDARQNGWVTKEFDVHLNGNTIIEISALHVGVSAVLLGDLSLSTNSRR